MTTHETKAIELERVERIAAAVDEVTDGFGLNCGEALFAFVAMIKTTLDSTDDPAVRAVMKKAVIDSITTESLVPIVRLMEGKRAPS